MYLVLNRFNKNDFGGRLVMWLGLRWSSLSGESSGRRQLNLLINEDVIKFRWETGDS